MRAATKTASAPSGRTPAPSVIRPSIHRRLISLTLAALALEQAGSLADALPFPERPLDPSRSGSAAWRAAEALVVPAQLDPALFIRLDRTQKAGAY